MWARAVTAAGGNGPLGAVAGFLGMLLAVPLTAAVLAALAELSAAGYFDTAPAAPGDVTP